MSENVPLEIQANIIKRLPIRSLIQFRSVYKSWKTLIDSSDFILHYSSDVEHLLVSYGGYYYKRTHIERDYISIVGDDSFPRHKISLNPPMLVNRLEFPNIIGSSHGLLCLQGNCLHGNYRESHDPIPAMATAVVWNLSIRKAVAVVLPDVGYGRNKTVLGFGVCSETNDPKIVKFTLIRRWTDVESIPRIPWQVDVFTLSTNVWRSLDSNLPRTSIQDFSSQVVVNGFVYWLAFEAIAHDADDDDDGDNDDDDDRYYGLVISFNLTSEEFREVILPDHLAYHESVRHFDISKLKNSLVVIERDEDTMGLFVWMMEGGVPETFTKLFHLFEPDALLTCVREFRKTGEAVIELFDDNGEFVVAYEPHSKHINDLGIRWFPRDVHFYMETLLLLDQPDSVIYNPVWVLGKRYMSEETDTDEGAFEAYEQEGGKPSGQTFAKILTVIEEHLIPSSSAGQK